MGIDLVFLTPSRALTNRLYDKSRYFCFDFSSLEVLGIEQRKRRVRERREREREKRKKPFIAVSK